MTVVPMYKRKFYLETEKNLIFDICHITTSKYSTALFLSKMHTDILSKSLFLAN